MFGRLNSKQGLDDHGKQAPNKSEIQVETHHKTCQLRQDCFSRTFAGADAIMTPSTLPQTKTLFSNHQRKKFNLFVRTK